MEFLKVKIKNILFIVCIALYVYGVEEETKKEVRQEIINYCSKVHRVEKEVEIPYTINAVTSVAVSADAKVVIGVHDTHYNLMLRAGEEQNFVGIKEYEGGGPVSLAFSQDGKKFISVTKDSYIELRSADDGKVSQKLEHSPLRPLYKMALFSPDGVYIVACGGNVDVDVWKSDGDKEVFKKIEILAALSRVDCVRFFSETEIIIAGEEGLSLCAILPTISCKDVLFKKRVDYFAIKGNKVAFVSANKVHCAKILTENGKRVLGEEQQLDDLGAPITSLIFSEDGRFISIGMKSGKDGLVIWDVKEKKIVYTSGRRIGPVLSLAFSQKDNMLWVGCEKRFVDRLWGTIFGTTSIPLERYCFPQSKLDEIFNSLTDKQEHLLYRLYRAKMDKKIMMSSQEDRDLYDTFSHGIKQLIECYFSKQAQQLLKPAVEKRPTKEGRQKIFSWFRTTWLGRWWYGK